MRPQLGYEMGGCQIIQGDSRQLENILCDAVITSPPFAGQSGGLRSAESFMYGNDNVGKRMMGGIKGGTGESPDNIDKLPYGEVDKVSAIITSPPYEGAMDGGSRHTKGGIPQRDLKMKRLGSYDTENKQNIGNLYKDSYLSAMLQVYQSCFAVLRSGGFMVLVVKNFLRNQKEVDLKGDTIKLCQQAGFTFTDEHHRILSSQSFWRIIYQKRYPQAPVVDREYVLVFKK